MNKSDSPFFSIIIPVYNSEQYLNDCIQSVFIQSCNDFELILIDDESKDHSSEICDKWEKKHPDKVRVIHQKNTGVYIAKRNGIKASKGQYLYVMDNDDLLTTPKAFEIFKEKISDSNCDLIIFNATDNIKTSHLLCDIPFFDGEIFEKERLAYIYDEYLSTKNLHHIWMMVFSRELFDWGFEYKESFKMLRDGPSLVLPIISNAKKILYIKDILYYWRIQNQTSASKHYDIENFYISIRYLHKKVLDYSKTWKYKSDITEKLIRKSYIVDICIAAIKVRSISKNSSKSRKEYLQMLSSDEMFRHEYTLENLELFRRIVAFALYYRQYWLVNTLSTLVGIYKGR